MENAFAKLNAINVNGKTESKNGLTYLSWAWAWAEVKKLYPDANYTIYERPDGIIYWTDGKTCWVKTGVTIEGLEHIEYLPVMDYKNRSIPLDSVTSYDVNKTIQRSLTKACARHGLGLYIYAGEDLPEDGSEEPKPKAAPKAKPKEAPKAKPNLADMVHVCTDCGKEIKVKDIEAHVNKCLSRWGAVVCGECAKKRLAESDKIAEESDKIAEELAQDLKHIEEPKRKKVNKETA